VTREQLEHILRAASTIAGDPDVLVIGSQSVLGSFAGSRCMNRPFIILGLTS
jgi:hypothetical protein